MMHLTRKAAGLTLAVALLASPSLVSPSLAQTFDSSSASINRDGTLNVWGAHIDPPRARGGLLGGVGNVVGGVVGGTVGVADDIVTGSVGPRRGGAVAYDGDAGQSEGFVQQGGRLRRGSAY